MTTNRLFLRAFLLPLAGLLFACAGKPPEVEMASWVPSAGSAQATGESCLSPLGLFANHGQISPISQNNYASPTLAEILFENKLAGYPIEAVRISQGDRPEQLLVKGVLGGEDLLTPLSSGVMDGDPIIPIATLTAVSEDCTDRWAHALVTKRLDSNMVSASVLYTGGTLMPLNEVSRLTLTLADDGALLIHVKERSYLLVALVIPVAINRDYWLRFSPYSDPLLQAQGGGL